MLKILEITSKTPNAARAIPKNIKILFIVRMDFCLNDLEIIVYPINRPINHNNKKDLCIAPPNTVIAKRKK